MILKNDLCYKGYKCYHYFKKLDLTRFIMKKKIHFSCLLCPCPIFLFRLLRDNFFTSGILIYHTYSAISYFLSPILDSMCGLPKTLLYPPPKHTQSHARFVPPTLAFQYSFDKVVGCQCSMCTFFEYVNICYQCSRVPWLHFLSSMRFLFFLELIIITFIKISVFISLLFYVPCHRFISI